MRKKIRKERKKAVRKEETSESNLKINHKSKLKPRSLSTNPKGKNILTTINPNSRKKLKRPIRKKAKIKSNNHNNKKINNKSQIKKQKTKKIKRKEMKTKKMRLKNK
jgi:hypothetical protein